MLGDTDHGKDMMLLQTIMWLLRACKMQNPHACMGMGLGMGMPWQVPRCVQLVCRRSPTSRKQTTMDLSASKRVMDLRGRSARIARSARTPPVLLLPVGMNACFERRNRESGGMAQGQVGVCIPPENAGHRWGVQGQGSGGALMAGTSTLSQLPTVYPATTMRKSKRFQGRRM